MAKSDHKAPPDSKKGPQFAGSDHEEMSSSSRRHFLRSSAMLGAAVGAVATIGCSSDNGNGIIPSAAAASSMDPTDEARTNAAADIRIQQARSKEMQTAGLSPQEVNDDETLYASEAYYASFTKTLPHNEFGEVTPEAFEALVAACEDGRFGDVPLDPTASRTLANPQGAFRFIFAGLDGHATRMRAAPAFASAETAAEMGELYWQALTRDVPFANYDIDQDIAAACADLNSFSETVGPKAAGLVTPETLFRGEAGGDLVGPYISQFLWKNVPYGPTIIEQRYEVPLSFVDTMVTEGNWLNIQRGGAPLEVLGFDPDPRFIYDNRSLGEYVHRDVLFQAYLNAALILLSFGREAVDRSNPYFNETISNQGAFTSLGGPFILDLVTQAGNLALSSAWYQKWNVHRRLRPETYGGRVHFHVNQQRSYDIHPDLLGSNGLARTFSQNDSYLLPQAYPEGSPTHPAYPAGHATIAGCCVTVLKAFFDERFEVPEPVVANATGSFLDPFSGILTVGNELDKLASNVAIGRDAAGVHYRSDGIDGLLVGEQQAIGLLQDYSVSTNEEFSFSLTKFDGTTININRDQIEVA